MPPERLYDGSGQPLDLGPVLGTGGEGTVREVPARPTFVAKIYHQPPSADRAAKLAAMARLVVPELLKFAAWPTATLHESPGGRVLGMLMPRVTGHREIHTLYSPAHRKKDFPEADWAFLVHTAMNCAIALDRVHSRGHVMGDVNQRNILVSSRATVTLIDCDSFQVVDGATVHPCEVGVPEYTPPELQGQAFKGQVRTVNHDRFGLAVLIFHLLFMGRHPFAGVFQGVGDMTLDRAILEYRFAYGQGAAAAQMAPLPRALPLTAVSPEISALFEKAFGRDGAQSGARPAPLEWFKALDGFKKSLLECPMDPGHLVPGHLSVCPWCALMQGGAPNFFITVSAYRVHGPSPTGFVLVAFWEQVERVPPPPRKVPKLAPVVAPLPNPLPAELRAPLPVFTPPQLPPRIRIPLKRTQHWAAKALLASTLALVASCCVSKVTVAVASVWTLGFAVWFGILEYRRATEERLANFDYEMAVEKLRLDQEKHERLLAERRQRRFGEGQRRAEACGQAQAELDGAKEEIQSLVEERFQAFQDLKNILTTHKNHYENLATDQQNAIRELEKNVAAIQLTQHLQSQFLSDYDIAGIGRQRESVLRSYGIETAFDVQQLQSIRIPGFGPKLSAALLAWREEIEKNFRFDPRGGIPPSELNRVALEYRQLRQHLEQEMQNGLGELRSISAETERRLAESLSRIQILAVRAAQAEADLAVMNG